MSEETREIVDLADMGDNAFGTLMDALAPEEGAEAVGAGETTSPATPTANTDAPAGSDDTAGGSTPPPGQPAEGATPADTGLPATVADIGLPATATDIGLPATATDIGLPTARFKP